jgi:uncharacterized membrane protein YccC
MKQRSNMSLGSVVLALLAFVMVACATTRSDSLRISSQRLEDRASEFYSQIRYEGDNSRRDRVSRDAQALADSARSLNSAVDRGLTSEQVREKFDRASRDYDRLQQGLADAGFADQNRRVLEDFDRVTDAYRDVESAFGARYSRVN